MKTRKELEAEREVLYAQYDDPAIANDDPILDEIEAKINEIDRLWSIALYHETRLGYPKIRPNDWAKNFLNSFPVGRKNLSKKQTDCLERIMHVGRSVETNFNAYHGTSQVCCVKYNVQWNGRAYELSTFLRSATLIVFDLNDPKGQVA